MNATITRGDWFSVPGLFTFNHKVFSVVTDTVRTECDDLVHVDLIGPPAVGQSECPRCNRQYRTRTAGGTPSTDHGQI